MHKYFTWLCSRKHLPKGHKPRESVYVIVIGCICIILYAKIKILVQLWCSYIDRSLKWQKYRLLSPLVFTPAFDDQLLFLNQANTLISSENHTPLSFIHLTVSILGFICMLLHKTFAIGTIGKSLHQVKYSICLRL